MSEPERLSDLAAAYVAAQCAVLQDATDQLRAREPVVHTTRVAARRLRSTIRVFAELFDVPQSGLLEEELTWWAGLLSDVRDLEVLTGRLEQAIGALPPELVVGPVLAAVERELAVRRQDGWGRITETLGSDRYGRLLGLLAHWRSDPPFTPAAARPATAVKSYVRQAERKVEKRLAAARRAYAAGDPDAAAMVHRARKAAKRHRYAVELAEPLWGSKATKIVERRKMLQDVLGEHQDTVVCAAFLRDFGIRTGSRPGHNGFTYGLLYAAQRHELERMPTTLETLIR